MNDNSTNPAIFDSGSVDVKEIMETVRKRVDEKKAAGVYDRYNLTGITKLEIAEVKSDEDFLNYYLKVMQKSYELDIGEFDIPSKGGLVGKPAVWLKKIIWSLLKFYTYRMFTQQREFNLQVVNTLKGLNHKIDKQHQEIMEKLDQIRQ
jgi:hypothetical protein